jgi:hypothetical protein
MAPTSTIVSGSKTTPRILDLATMDPPPASSSSSSSSALGGQCLGTDDTYQHGTGDRYIYKNLNQPFHNISGTPTTITTTTTTTTNKTTNNGINVPKDPSSSVIQEAQKTLAKILPTEVHLDTTMMEHLARAAMELHNKRTGRGMLQERSSKSSPFSSSLSSTMKRPLPGGVAWTDDEKKKCLLAAEMYGSGNVDKIAAHVGSRTAGEVRAHLKNVNERGKIERQITGGTRDAHSQEDDDYEDEEQEQEQDDEGGDGDDSHHGLGGSSSVGGGKKRKMSDAMGCSDGSMYKGGDVDEMSCSPASSGKRSRGRKAPSKAMLTLPYAVFDAKKMVSGKL